RPRSRRSSAPAGGTLADPGYSLLANTCPRLCVGECLRSAHVPDRRDSSAARCPARVSSCGVSDTPARTGRRLDLSLYALALEIERRFRRDSAISAISAIPAILTFRSFP